MFSNFFPTDIDECLVDNGDCGDVVGAICTNLPGTFTCACRVGFEGAPPTCSGT